MSDAATKQRKLSGPRPRAAIPNEFKCMTDTELQRERLETDAVHILEKVLHRTRWVPKDRDALAEALSGIITREDRHRRGIPNG